MSPAITNTMESRNLVCKRRLASNLAMWIEASAAFRLAIWRNDIGICYWNAEWDSGTLAVADGTKADVSGGVHNVR